MKLNTKTGGRLALTGAAVLVLVGGISALWVTASDDDAARQRAVDNATGIVDPKDPPRLPVLSEFGESGDPAEVATVKAAVPQLVHRLAMTMVLPDQPARAEAIGDPAKKAKRQAEIRSAVAASSADATVKEVEAALRLVQDDATYRNFTDHRLVVQKWYGVTVDGRKAFAGFRAVESHFVPRMNIWQDSHEGQWHVWLEKDGDTWKLVEKRTKLDASP